jgi:hypothetical protein
MAAVIDASVGGVASNSYATAAEAATYFETRIPLPIPWVASGQEAVLIMATRVLDALAQPYKTFFAGPPPYYRVRRAWTGTPATTTQRLAWPRVGMYDANGNLIPSNVIPQALKDAQAELAGQLLSADRTLDNDIVAQGITSIRAGSVALSFKEGGGTSSQVIPDAVYNLMPVSWLTDETYETVYDASDSSILFDVVSKGSSGT